MILVVETLKKGITGMMETIWMSGDLEIIGKCFLIQILYSRSSQTTPPSPAPSSSSTEYCPQ